MLRLDAGQMPAVDLQALADLFSAHSQAPGTQLSPLPRPDIILANKEQTVADPEKSSDRVQLIPSQKRRHGGFGFVAMMNGYVYHCDYQREGSAGARVYWKCTQRGGCGARLITDKLGLVLNARNNFHSHPPVDENPDNGTRKLEDKDENAPFGSRKQNFNANLAFVKEIHKRKHVLFGSPDHAQHMDVSQIKEKAWEEIREAMTQQGHSKFVGKDWRQLRANEWQQVRRATMAKKYVNDMSGAKGANLNELDQLVLEVVGHESENEGTEQENNSGNGLRNVETALEPLQLPQTNSTMPNNDLLSTILSQFDPSALQQLTQSQTPTLSPDEEANKKLKMEDGADAFRCSPSSSFDDVVDQNDVNFEDLRLRYTREKYRLSIAQEKAKLDLLQTQLNHELQLHEIRLQSEKARLKYEEMRLKREEELQ
ncbi:unnamed protein product [Bursaphelenchus okinawaensis]|uniref:FLYWCH-type domain-containing protein n=1 Tax=Bursaphelenchus okinawaensis TaxID=465554 RepID=A0A811KY68_9BILA|nr:unnamed protein product [Bursaphelenchus okinawaensis]CAG9112932.1 unnamed protein product [Bursaphelenchus okinawaensis]